MLPTALICAFKVAEFRTLGDGFVPAEMYKKWTRLFIKGQKIGENYYLEADGDAVALPVLADAEDNAGSKSAVKLDDIIDKNSLVYHGIKYLDNEEFHEFVNLSGTWAIDETK